MSARSRQAYKNALSSLAARTGTPLPSLIVSFAILHEITAIVPLAGLFFGAKYLGVGERLVEHIRTETHADAVGTSDQPFTKKLARGKGWGRGLTREMCGLRESDGDMGSLAIPKHRRA
jgi:hypothetical protein